MGKRGEAWVGETDSTARLEWAFGLCLHFPEPETPGGAQAAPCTHRCLTWPDTGQPPPNCFSAIHLATTFPTAQGRKHTQKYLFLTGHCSPATGPKLPISDGAVFGTAPFVIPTAASGLGSAHTKF